MQRLTKWAGLVVGCAVIATGCSMKSSGARMAASKDQCCGKVDTTGWKHFGEPMKKSGQEAMCAGQVLAQKDAYGGKTIRVAGKVNSVCASRGCWMRLGCGSSSDTLFVKFTCPVEGRLIPMEAVGHRAVVEGQLEVKEISQEEARHYQEEGGASPEAVAAIVGPQKIVSMRSPAAVIDGLN